MYDNSRQQGGPGQESVGHMVTRVVGVGLLAVLGLGVAVMLFLGIWIGVGTVHGKYARGQRVKNAQNAVTVERRQIQLADIQALAETENVKVVTAKAQQRLEEAKGIRAAQDEISSTLTPLYVQHEAIQAQEAIANSGRNNTVIYVPAGTNGVPTVVSDPAALAGQNGNTPG